jgi:hypothetical protein
MRLSAFAALAVLPAASGFRLHSTVMSARGTDRVDRRDVVRTALGAAVGGGMLAALGVSGPSRRVWADSGVPSEGIQAPDFTLPSSLGKDLSLKDITTGGKYTVLYFFPAAFTSGKAPSLHSDVEVLAEIMHRLQCGGLLPSL